MRTDFVYANTFPGPRTPPPLDGWIEWRQENAPFPWHLYRADGSLAGKYRSLGEAQAAFGGAI